MAIKCPSCGGKMIFNVPNQGLKCRNCDNETQVDYYDLSNEAGVSKGVYSVTVYSCPNCGAELSASDEQTAAYCSYCGSESILTMKQGEVAKPKLIIPFKISKEKAVRAYEKSLRYRPYVPKELKEGEYIGSFRGIYIPYLSYELDVPDNAFEFMATKSYTIGGWDYYEEYEVKVEIGGTIKGISFDASSPFDDSIAREIAPFDTTDGKEFKEAYIAGFYSDMLTTPPETYGDIAEKAAIDSFYEDIGKKAGNVELVVPKEYSERKRQTGVDGYRYGVDLFPVWFLTWKKKSRVAYSVMNGQTGKLSMDIPVDKKAFFLASGIAAVALFIIFSLMPIFILPTTISWAAAVSLTVSSIAFFYEILKIYYRENHIFNIGNASVNKAEQKKEQERRKKKAKSKIKKRFLFIMVASFSLFIILAFFAIANVVGKVNLVIYAVTLLLHIILFIKIKDRVAKIEKKTAFIPMLFGIIVLVVGLVIVIINPVYDYWYYGIAILCLLAMLANTISMINYLNYLTTRPVPDFFRREGADHGK
ncbi:MAG TPA: zinc ribbon domain-containing protein [Spirochaetota bacterium]|nr:zinc ribbon domain-containing protein [Spirochaetota bacterium]HOS33133.1 zinc ribbon domain-containing protein [Spirochaetota bacterium]HOS56188.1 zinc ribbon domain-containing protein [Spirochaetota bacterium]HPK62509.1 zinc ribbon domain-containing protein [Spirochaetota bacterium]HQF78609.1 zinc ribbon domain-containing protein [Spirochaetota bacterium]